MNRMSSENFVYNLYTSDNFSKNKTIILFHGWGSSVNNYRGLAEYFSSIGFRVIVPEILYHDSRDKLDNHFQKEVTQKYFWKTILKSIDESTLLLEELKLIEQEVILMGISMGGFIATGIHAKGNNYGGLINVNGSGSFLLSEKIFREGDQRPDLTFEESNELKVYDPVGKKISCTPILLMHGEKDSIVSMEGQNNYFHYLLSYDSNIDVVFKIYENVNHTVNDEMLDYIKHWLEERY